MQLSPYISVIYSKICNCASLIPQFPSLTESNKISKQQKPFRKMERVSRCDVSYKYKYSIKLPDEDGEYTTLKNLISLHSSYQNIYKK